MWKNVIGQDRVKKIIQQALQSRKIPNAYLFMGQKGIGKDAVAIELAKTLNCTAPSSGPRLEACDECESCKQIASLGSPLLQFIFARAKETKNDDPESDDEGKDVDLVREQLALKASDPYHNIHLPSAHLINVLQIRRLRLLLSRSMTGGNKRVLIISEADMMNTQAQNAFLKTLEEPHSNTLVILTSSNPVKLHATILSRCQDLRFDLLSPQEIAGALQDRDGLDTTQAEFLSRLAGGSYSVARSLVNEDIAALRQAVVQLLRMALSHSRKNIIAEIDTILPRTGGGSFLEKRQTIEQFLHLLTLWLRDALALASGTGDYLFNSDQLEPLKNFTAKFGNPKKIAEALHHIEIAQRNVALQLQLRPVILEMIMNIERSLV